jgi:hypothetical protein
MTPFESLVSQLAAATGLPLEVDARDSCSLETDGLVITLQYRRGRDDLVIFAPVTDPDAKLAPETLRSALALACHGEGTHGNFLGLFEGTLLLSAVLPLEGLDADALAARLLAFSDTALGVRATLAAPTAAPADAPPADGIQADWNILV